ncbi:MAG: hypothetical protein AB7N65_24205 [Vicinamibacterales bacterium]
MNSRPLGTRGLVVAAMVAVGLGTVLGAQAPAPQASPARVAEAPYVPTRTPDGQPNISGMWLPDPSGRPMEVPAGTPWKPPAGFDPGTNAAYTFFAPETGTARRERDRRPMIIDPPDGRIPLQPWAAEQREKIVAGQEKAELLDPRVRCLQSGLPRANLPVFYNSYQIMQTPGYVVILYEWNHMTRFIPLDGRPHVHPKVRLPMGDSRGRWEGNTLVVDVTNFTDRTWAVGHGAPPEGAPASAISTGHGVFHSEALHVVERFTMKDKDTIHYEATIEDPKVFTRPWTIAFDAFVRAPSDHMLFEYACHEGNGRNVKLLTGVDIEN